MIHILNHSLSDSTNSLLSLAARFRSLHTFERDINEKTGIIFQDSPWNKPLRFPSESKSEFKRIVDYPFYKIEGEDLHEVGVGPVHAGIIEPGHFRFLCNGETVLNLEIQLGYQHRGIEKLFVSSGSSLYQIMLSESIAGDTTIGHSLATAQIIESLANVEVSAGLNIERFVALEMERIAMHLADSAALCTDVAYQLGQVTIEALRTLVINAMQSWCGNRFGKGLIRPSGTHYPLTPEKINQLKATLEEVRERYSQISHRIFSLPSVLDRFESIGKLSLSQVQEIGAVGMAAKSAGLKRDSRWSHPAGHYSKFVFDPVVLENGDVWARAMLRNLEIIQSVSMISKALGKWTATEFSAPSYNSNLQPDSICVSLTEGWRGEICHAAITNSEGKISSYSVKDPSVHNWTALAVALQNQEISDFPLCNKSFNLSYCGHDL